jgi:8-oxo-dGTP pyrophosphatase MutT (NUDIX family)
VTHTDRTAARVLLIDAAGRTLLFRGGDPARPGLRWWFTPGGGLDAGETPARGAARELLEETGLRVDPAELGAPIWHEVTEFTYRTRWYRQSQDFFVLHLGGPRHDGWRVDTAGFDADERAVVDEHRWWTADEIDDTDETVYPTVLSALLRHCLQRAAGDAVPLEGFRC